MPQRNNCARIVLVSTALLAGSIVAQADSKSGAKQRSLVGAWTTKIQFVDGPYAAVKDLKFQLVINAGGTMTESSNYDESQPVPPAYGIWRKTGRRRFELHYEYFNTKAPKKFEEITGGGGWAPAGWGVFKEKVKLAADGNSYTSDLVYILHDDTGKVIPGGGKAICKGEKMRF